MACFTYQLHDSKVFLPPEVFADGGPEHGQSVVSVHEDVDATVYHRGEEGCKEKATLI